eukprot:539093_1
MARPHSKDSDMTPRSVHLIHKITQNDPHKYKTTKNVIHDLYLNKLLLHPDQIHHIKISSFTDMNTQYKSIYLLIRSSSERDLFIFKLLTNYQTDKSLWLNQKKHGKYDLFPDLHKRVMVINFASNARNIHCPNITPIPNKLINQCIISRWKGIAIINTQTKNKFIEIHIPIEPYYKLKSQINKNQNKNNNPKEYIKELHTLQK